MEPFTFIDASVSERMTAGKHGLSSLSLKFLQRAFAGIITVLRIIIIHSFPLSVCKMEGYTMPIHPISGFFQMTNAVAANDIVSIPTCVSWIDIAWLNPVTRVGYEARCGGCEQSDKRQPLANRSATATKLSVGRVYTYRTITGLVSIVWMF